MLPDAYSALERRLEILTLLITIRHDHGAAIDELLSAALTIIRPNIRAGRQVPIGEILLDARLGANPSEWRAYSSGLRQSWEISLSHPAPSSKAVKVALATLDGYPMALHGPMMAAIICCLEWEFGPLKMIDDPILDDLDLPHQDAHRRKLKFQLHEAVEQRCSSARSDLMGGAIDMWWNDLGLRGRLQALAAGAGYVCSPEHMVRLSEWLPASFVAAIVRKARRARHPTSAA